MELPSSGWVDNLSRSGVEAQAIIIENNAPNGVAGYGGGDVWLDPPVRVQPVNEPAFEAQMKCRPSQSVMLQKGGTVTVRYDPDNKNQVILMGNAMTDLMAKYMK